MTEEEAKTKWCPYARAQTADTDNAPAVNRTLQGAPDIGAHCIGSACMAWRISAPAVSGGLSGTTGNYVHARPADGYCGLAGRP